MNGVSWKTGRFRHFYRPLLEPLAEWVIVYLAGGERLRHFVRATSRLRVPLPYGNILRGRGGKTTGEDKD